MGCDYCGESRFANAAQQSCHVSKNHAEFACTCTRRYTSQQDLDAHKTKMAEEAKDSRCSCCCRSFETVDGLHQHQRSKCHWVKGERIKAQEVTGRYYCHDKCGRSFRTEHGLLDHAAHFTPGDGQQKCYDCLKTFADLSRLAQHQGDTKHKNKSSPKDRNQMVNAFYDRKVKVDPAEKRLAVHHVTSTLRDVMDHVRSQPGGKIYSADIYKAGSNAAKTKIGKPDEFDTNIPLAVKGTQEITRGKLDYAYKKPKDSGQGVPAPNNMNVAGEIIEVSGKSQKEIPMGHAVIKAGETTKVPDNLKHNGHLVPREIKRDLHGKVKTAINELGLGDTVHLSRDAHGPAITATTTQPGGYNISVDIVPTHPSSVPVSVYGWPRPDTRRAYSEDQIKTVTDAGLHLVPKGDTTWYISYSKAEKAMFSALDRGNGCRKEVLKCMKKLVMDASSRSTDGLPGVTSHLVKNQLLWTSEHNPKPDHWRKANFAERLVDTMADFEYALKSGKLPNYFNTSENILMNKDRDVLHYLADELHKERMKLMHM